MAGKGQDSKQTELAKKHVKVNSQLTVRDEITFMGRIYILKENTDE